jgi:maltooligosyltrehalose trehalohydrolase
MHESQGRRLAVGAEVSREGTHFRVWAPKHRNVAVALEDDGSEHELAREPGGWFGGFVGVAHEGARYRFRTADNRMLPDPASRYQPDGPHGSSMIIDPDAFDWTDTDWNGPGEGRHVIYELHAGTFTRSGTWQTAAAHLDDLADLGITIIEIMPVAEFPGRFNWGYDGVCPFAPAHVYGTPDDMRSFVDRAHALGLAVILDVVYNHMGPDGCYLREFAQEYFSTRHTTDWGEALNFDDAGSEHVREYFLANAEYWIREFHLDGLRLDATQNIYDDGPHHIVTDLVQRVHDAAGTRSVWMVAENEPQEVRFVLPRREDGHGMDAMWNDDFHHSARVALTGMKEAYYSDYTGSPQELISCARHGFLYQGQHYRWQQKRRGTSTRGVPARAFVNYLQNHDQIANSAAGQRIHELANPGALRAMTALLLLMPGTAMLFQGQEFAASARFVFFADHKPELARQVYAGRREFLAQFPSMALPSVQETIEDPSRPALFERSRLDHDERRTSARVLQLHRDLIALSRRDQVFARQDAAAVDGAVLSHTAFVLRFSGDERDDRLLVVNLGADLQLDTLAEPLLAGPAGRPWRMLLSTEDTCYGGRGALHPERDAGWMVPARSATVLASGKTSGGRSNV